MKQFDVGGMSCAACSARVEKAVSQLDGVSSCSVSLLTNSMGVEGSADSAEIIKAVENAGYGVFHTAQVFKVQVRKTCSRNNCGVFENINPRERRRDHGTALFIRHG